MVIEEAGHFAPIERPRAVAEALAAWALGAWPETAALSDEWSAFVAVVPDVTILHAIRAPCPTAILSLHFLDPLLPYIVPTAYSSSHLLPNA